MKTNIILLTGYAQSGKDTVADYLVNAYKYEKISFAQPLYAMLVAMFSHTGITEHMIKKMKVNGGFLPDCNVEVRRMLQSLGTEWGRQFIRRSIWPSIVKQKISISDSKRFVIPDCRFINEYHKFNHDNQFITHMWGIKRKKALPKPHGGEFFRHESEKNITSLFEMADVIINNDFDMKSLFSEVDIEFVVSDVAL